MAKKKQAKKSAPAAASGPERDSSYDLATLIHSFGLVAAYHLSRAKNTGEREALVSLVREHVKAFYFDLDGGAGIDCGPLCDIEGECLPCGLWSNQ